MLSKSKHLYDGCIFLHTTVISYREIKKVLGIKGIDEYIRYGGTMSLGGINYNEGVAFTDISTFRSYVDSAIAKNIQHSLRYYQGGGHFHHLADKEKCAKTEHRFGTITGKYVLYHGATQNVNGIHYVNVEKYLNNVCKF